MSRIRKLAVAAGTFSLALGVGFVMQNGDVLAARLGGGGGSVPDAQAAGPLADGAAGMSAAVSQADTRRITTPDDPVAVAALPLAPPAPGAGDAGLDIRLPADAAPVPVLAGGDLAGVAPLPAVAGIAAGDGADLVTADAAMPDLVEPDLGGDVAGESDTFLAALMTEDAPAADPAPQLLADDACRSEMRAEVLPLGLVSLELSSPCAPNAQVAFLHQGMMFAEVTDAAGRIALVVPALAEQAMFLADVTGAAGAVAMVEVPEMAGLHRAVLQWQGGSDLVLRALEFGAGYGTDGDVWAGAPRGPGVDGGGFLIELGDPALTAAQRAQVYTFPVKAGGDGMAGDGDVALSVEIEVTADNCGREMAAQSLQLAPGGGITAHDLTLRLPGCDTVGDLLVVPGMLEDLYLAAS